MFGNYRDQMIQRHLGGGQQPMQQQTPQQGGVFGRPKRNTGQRVAGYVADALAGLAGRQGPYAAMLGQESAMADQEAAYQRQRADAYTDWQKKQEYERANPKPTNNDTIADYQFLLEKLGPEAAQMFLQNRADPPQYRQGPDGQFYRVQTNDAPARPVGRLTPIEGGPGGSPSGAGFRP